MLSSKIISWNFICNTKGIFISWECYRSRPFAGNKHARSQCQFSCQAGHVNVVLPGTRRNIFDFLYVNRHYSYHNIPDDISFRISSQITSHDSSRRVMSSDTVTQTRLATLRCYVQLYISFALHCTQYKPGRGGGGHSPLKWVGGAAGGSKSDPVTNLSNTVKYIYPVTIYLSQSARAVPPGRGRATRMHAPLMVPRFGPVINIVGVLHAPSRRRG